MVQVGRDLKYHLVPRCMPWTGIPFIRPGCSKPHPTWPSPLPERGHPQLVSKNQLLVHILTCCFSVAKPCKLELRNQLKFLQDRHFLATLPHSSARLKDMSFELSEEFGFDFLCIHTVIGKERFWWLQILFLVTCLCNITTNPTSSTCIWHWEPFKDVALSNKSQETVSQSWEWSTLNMLLTSNLIINF